MPVNGEFSYKTVHSYLFIEYEEREFYFVDKVSEQRHFFWVFRKLTMILDFCLIPCMSRAVPFPACHR
jgi:hypothetical protein